MPADHQVDWTLSEAPAAADWPAEPPPGQPARRRALPRRAWLALAALPVLALLFTWLYAQWETARLRRDVTAVVAEQEQARLDGDWTRLRRTFMGGPLGWSSQRISLLQSGTGGVPMPIELPGFWLAHQAGQVTQFQIQGAQQARADVTRVYESQSGAHITLTLPQYYQFSDGAWRETAPPQPAASEALALHGAYVDVDYFPADAALAASLRDDLDALLARACADWDCPADLRVPVRFETGDTFARNYTLPADIFLDSWTLQVIAARENSYLVREVTLPTGPEGGYAADPTAAEAVRRVAGITALLRVAQRVAPESPRHGNNAYLGALVAREAARLGLDAPELAQARTANPLFATDELWSLGQDDYTNASAGAQALVILNQLLAGRPLADERRLLHSLDTASEPGAWLAAGLGLPLAQAQASLAAAASFSAPPPRAQPPSFTPALVLNCASGPLFADLQGQAAPLFDASVRDAFVRDWSPGGRRLAVSIAGRLGMLDLETSGGAWAPQPALPYAVPIRWASDSVLAYPAVTRDTSQPAVILTSGLSLWEAGSGQYLATQSGENEYALSPDGGWAALVGSPYSPNPTLSVAPALGGGAVFTASNGHSPAWSFDSRELAYTQLTSTVPRIVLFDRVSGLTRTVLAGDDPRLPQAATRLSAAWSPAADRLSISFSFNGDNSGGWAGLLSVDGRSFEILPAPEPRGELVPDGFSADGQFLSVAVYDGGHDSTAVYSALDGRLLQFILDRRPQGWSPTGHTLALLSLEGASLLREPDDPQAAPVRLGPDRCNGVVWRPALVTDLH